MVSLGELTRTECRMLAAVAVGEELDLRVGDAELDDPSNGAAWDEARSVRAEFLYELCVGAHDEWRVHARGLRLRGARVTSELSFEAASVAFPLTLRDCWFDRPLVLTLARLVTLRLPGCYVPGITADQLDARGSIELNDGFQADGEVRLVGAHIGGALDCAGGTFANPGGRALTADQLTVKQGMLCRDGFYAHGEVRLNAAHIGTALDCDGATFTNPDGYALNCDKTKVEQSMLCRNGFYAHGEVCLNAAHIGTALECDGATFTNPDGYALYAANLTVGQNMLCHYGFHAHGEVNLRGARIGGTLDCAGGTFSNPTGHALNAEGLTVEQNMYCTNGFHAHGEVFLFGAHIGGVLAFDAGPSLNSKRARVSGIVNLTHARVGVLVDAQESWPAALRLDGFVYDAIRATPEVSVEQRLMWLARDPDGYSPQKYEQLAAVYRRAGQEQEARQVAIAKQRARRQQLPRPARLWNRLLGVTVGYGYQPWRALWWLAGFVAVGALLFASAYPQAMTATAPTGQLPVFEPVVYALDVLLPIVDLRQQDFWIPNAASPWGWAYLAWFWLSISAGWVLTTAVAAAVTGLLKTDSKLG